LPTATVERAIDRLPAPIQATVYAIAPAVEPLGRDIATARFGAIRRAIEPAIDAIATTVELLFPDVAAPVEALFDTVTALVGALAVLGVRLRGAHEQTQGHQYSTAFHRRPP
jgi:hypothetical protein